MPSKSKEFCSLIADEVLKNAAILSERFNKSLELNSQNEVFEKYLDKILFYSFAFMGWTISAGIWSNLSNIDLRRDLMNILKEQIIIGIGKRLADKSDPESQAAECSKLYNIFEKYGKKFKEGMLEFNSKNITVDSNSTLIMTLEWIKSELRIPENVMNKAVSKFQYNDCISDIEKITSQINIAAGEEG